MFTWTTPFAAFEPYSAEPGPRSTSTFFAMNNGVISQVYAVPYRLSFIGTPSTRWRMWLLFQPSNRPRDATVRRS